MPCYIDHLGLYAETFLQFITNLETMRDYDIGLDGAKCEFNQGAYALGVQ